MPDQLPWYEDLSSVVVVIPPNRAPKATYHLPTSDVELPEDIGAILRVHPLAYSLASGGGTYNRCPTCEEWTTGGGCEVRRLAATDIEAASSLHARREWPAGTSYARSHMKADYSLVTFRHG